MEQKLFLSRLLSARQGTTKHPLPLSGARILVVEDEGIVALEIAEIITQLGGAVAAMAHGTEQALNALNQNEIDCAILDVNLAGTLSYPIAASLRRRNIPFVYCTAYVDAASVFPPIAAAPRLGKPLQKEELRDTLVRVLTAAKP
jgi:CheY-like chemotaxis protein